LIHKVSLLLLLLFLLLLLVPHSGLLAEAPEHLKRESHRHIRFLEVRLKPAHRAGRRWRGDSAQRGAYSARRIWQSRGKDANRLAVNHGGCRIDELGRDSRIDIGLSEDGNDRLAFERPSAGVAVDTSLEGRRKWKV